MNTPPTSPVEDTLRSTLQRHASQPAPRGDAGDVRRRVQRRRRRRRAVPAAGAVAVIAAGLIATSLKDDPQRTETAAALDDGPATPGTQFAPRADAPAYVTLPGWEVTRYQEVRYLATADAPALTESEYQWEHAGQRMQLHFYDGGQAMYELRVSGDARSDVELFGLPASMLDYGNGRYRVDVLIGDYTLEFDGEPFASREDFLAVIGTLHSSTEAPPADVTAEPLQVDATTGANAVTAVGPPPPPVAGENATGTATATTPTETTPEASTEK